MIEFSFLVKLSFRDAQAFIGDDLERVHDRLNQRLAETLFEEFECRDGKIIVETEPA